MKYTLVVLLFLLPLPLVGADRPSLTATPDPESGSIGVSMTIKRFSRGSLDYFPAVRFYFVRLDESGDWRGAQELIESNWSDKKQVYLLNAEAGRYVAVAATIRGRGVVNALTISGGTATPSVHAGDQYDYFAFFSEETIPSTETTVRAGEVSFMGHIGGKTKLEPADTAQTHFAALLFPEAEDGDLEEIVTVKAKRVLRDLEAEIDFMTKAERKTFKDDEPWRTLVAAQSD